MRISTLYQYLPSKLDTLTVDPDRGKKSVPPATGESKLDAVDKSELDEFSGSVSISNNSLVLVKLSKLSLVSFTVIKEVGDDNFCEIK